MRLPLQLLRRSHGGPALLVSLVLLLISAATIGWGLHALRGARERLLQRDDDIRLFQQLQRDLRMAETGQRGYLLVNNPLYLGPYRAALAQIPADIQALRDAPLVDAGAIPRLDALVRRKLDELALTIRLHDRAPGSALAIVRTDIGQRYMDKIDALIGASMAHERDRLRAGTASVNRIANITAAAAGLATMLAIVAGVLGMVLVARQRRVDELQRLNEGLEMRIAERTHSLTLANQELDAFAYTISHDLRAPLRAIHGYADVIEEDAGDRLSDELRHYLRRIGVAADQMNRLIEDILAYARLAKDALAVRRVDLDAVVARAQEQLQADCSGATIRVDTPLGEVLAHPAALEQSVENLLSNACKYVAPGQTAAIHVHAEARRGQRRLWIRDNGIGIAPEHHERIFKPFERLHGVETYPGTGIGLAIVRRSIERMGGRSGVEPIPGGGSAFWIELPEPRPAA